MVHPLFDRAQVWARYYRSNMRWLHASIAAAFVLAAGVTAQAAPPHRIVSTFLCTDEYVFRLVPRDRIAALSFEAGDRHPVVSTIADVVDGIPQIHPTIETVLNYHPDLVVMYKGTNPHLLAQLDRIGVPVLSVPWANSLADIRRITFMLGNLLGARARAKQLITRMDETLRDVRAHRVTPPVSTIVFEANGYASTGSVTEALMDTAGLRDAAPGLGLNRMGRIPVETVVAQAPELLILSGRSEVRNARASLVQHHPALAALEGRTLMVWEPLRPLLCPGPWSAEAAKSFANLAAKAHALARQRVEN